MQRILSCMVMAAAMVGASAARAGIVVTAIDAIGAKGSPFPLANLGDAGYSQATRLSSSPVGMGNGGTVTFAPSTATLRSGLYSGQTLGVAASPYSGTGLADANYLVAEPNDPVTITFAAPTHSFSMLWGSIDSFNAVSLFLRLNGVIEDLGTITGQDALTDGHIPQTIPEQSAYVTFTDTTAFNSIVITSAEAATEFVPGLPVSEPAGLAAIGLSAVLLLARARAPRN